MGMSEEQLFRNKLNSSKHRNMPCVCGSGLKAKKCHGRDYAITKEVNDVIKNLVKDRVIQRAAEIKNQNALK